MHIQFAHNFWKQFVQKGDTVVDATCGNGKDSLYLATLALAPSLGSLHCIDIQKSAIDLTKSRLQAHLSIKQFSQVHFHHGSHEQIPLPPETARLIVYNLGYLPGGNKNLTTISETTIASVQQALEVLSFGGLLSITSYPGHQEGLRERNDLLKFISHLSTTSYKIQHLKLSDYINSPELIFILKNAK